MSDSNTSQPGQAPVQIANNVQQSNVNEGSTQYDTNTLPEDKKEGETPAKLFIGQIPRHITEADLRKIFEPFGYIQELIILRDKHTNIHRGCAFLTYATREAADKAIINIHEKISLHNRPIVVRYAGAANQPVETKLFVGMLSRTSTEEHIQNLFSKYGPVKEVYLMRDHSHVSKGCAFVKMVSRDDAIQAMQELNEIYQDEGAPRKLVVRFADSKSTKALHSFNAYPMYYNRLMTPYGVNPVVGGGRYPFATTPYYNQDYNSNYQSPTFPPPPSSFNSSYETPSTGIRGPSGSNLFIYNIPDTFTDLDLSSLFTNFGNVISTKVFRDKSTGLSRGFGFVSYDDPTSAEKAINALNGFVVGNKRLKVMHKKPTEHSPQSSHSQQPIPPSTMHPSHLTAMQPIPNQNGTRYPSY